MDMDTDKILAELAADSEPLQLFITPFKAFVILANLQLALRVSGNDQESAEIAREIAINLQKAITSIHPGMGEVIEKGWHPEWDLSREEFEEYSDLDDF